MAWALCAVGALVMFSGISVLTSIILFVAYSWYLTLVMFAYMADVWCQLVDGFMPSCSPTSMAVGTLSSR